MGTKLRYSEAYKIATLEGAKRFGIVKASEDFKVPTKTISRWNKEYRIYTVQKMRFFTDEQKKEILTYANQHGLTSTMREYNIAIHTMLKWNRTFKIYENTGRRTDATHLKKHTRNDKKYKLEVLNFAKRYGISKAIKKYNIPSATLQYWNAELKVYTVRKTRTFTPEQKAKIIQEANETSVADAAKKHKLYGHQIKTWMTQQQNNL